jgi:hypothetical protein
MIKLGRVCQWFQFAAKEIGMVVAQSERNGIIDMKIKV